MTRAEHMRWCKQRALEYLDRGDTMNAVTSMLSDLGMHPETKQLTDQPLYAMLGIKAMDSVAEARSFIQGFRE